MDSGFGRAIAEAAVAAGDTVIGTARRTGALARYGRVSVLVNNAGRTQVEAFEETTDRELRDLFELHVFGPARLTRALLPQMRERRGGSVVNISSFGGQLSFAGFSAYSATKAALEQLSEGLADEVAPFGIKVLIVVPGAFRTNLFGKGAAYFSVENPAYTEKVSATRRTVRGGDAVDFLTAHLESVRAELTEWEGVSRGTDFDTE